MKKTNKILFIFIFSSDLMCYKMIKVKKIVWVLYNTKNLSNPIKTGVSIRNIFFFQFVSGVLNSNSEFLLEKKQSIGLLKIIGIQINCMTINPYYCKKTIKDVV